MKPRVYEGDEPYIFVSYAHRDSETVMEVLGELEQRGYRLWYDDGIAPGSEWPEDIARHLDAAAMVVAFVTPNSMESRNCRREINFSLAREKNFLSVVLEPTEMPLGMEMQLSAQQSILRYNYDSWKGFIKKILACPDIEPCKAEPEPQPQETPQVEAGGSALVAGGQAPSEPAEEYHEVEVVPPAEVAPPAEAATSAEEPASKRRSLPKLGKGTKAKAQPAKKKPSQKTGKLPIPLIAVAAIALLAVIFAVRSMMGTTTTSWSAKVDKNATYVAFNDEKIEQEDLQSIAALEKLTAIKFVNCDLSACNFSAVTFASDKLDTIDLSGSTGLTDFRFLEKLTLKELRLSGMDGYNGLAKLDTSKLKILDISGTAVSDLSPLAGAPLTELSFSDTKVHNISVLADMADLDTVIGNNTQVNSLDALVELTGLQHIEFAGSWVGALKKPFASLRLSTVNLSGSKVTNLAGLADCTVLKELDLSKNKNLTSMDWMDAQNYATLKKLDLSQTGLAADSLSWIGSCTSLYELRLDGLSLGNLDICASLRNLGIISAVNCELEDISGLEECADLETIVLASNKIADVSPLAGLSLEHLSTIELSFNKIESLASLKPGQYRALMVYGNDERVAGTLPEGLSGYQLSTSWFEGIEETNIKDAFTTIYIVDCPQNQVVATEESLGKSAKLLSKDELVAMYEDDSFKYGLNQDLSYLSSLYSSDDENSFSLVSTGIPDTTFSVSYGD